MGESSVFTKVHIKGKQDGQRRRRQCDKRGRGWSDELLKMEERVCEPRNAGGSQKLEKTRTLILPRASVRNSFANTLILGPLYCRAVR